LGDGGLKCHTVMQQAAAAAALCGRDRRGGTGADHVHDGRTDRALVE
jgi:hypothetical protein